MNDAQEQAARIIAECMGASDNEALAMLQLRILLATGNLAKVFGVPAIADSRFQYAIPGYGIADAVLFHENGGLTLIEAKGPEGCRALVAGIGQLFMYEAGIRHHLAKAGRPVTFLHKVLCAPVTASASFAAWHACQVSGVRFVNLQLLDELRQAAEQDRQAMES